MVGSVSPVELLARAERTLWLKKPSQCLTNMLAAWCVTKSQLFEIQPPLIPIYLRTPQLASPHSVHARRRQRLLLKGHDFYANEHALASGSPEASTGLLGAGSGGGGGGASSHTCAEVQSVLVLREPLERLGSHVKEVTGVLSRWVRNCKAG